MNSLIRFTARRAIFLAERELENMKSAVASLKKIVETTGIDCMVNPFLQIDNAIKKMPEFSEDLTNDLKKIRELIEAENDDPTCNACGLTATVATEGGQGEERGCKCDTQADEDAIDLMRDDMESSEADMIEYQRTER